MSTVLEVQHLTVAYNGTHALEDISFQVQAAEQVAIVGPNGAGKSTLFRALVGLVRPKAGQIRTADVEIAYITQRSAVDWSFPVTVFDTVLMGRVGKIGWLRWQRPRDREIVLHSLEQVGMADLADRQIG